MKIIRKETWGAIAYDTSKHRFEFDILRDVNEQPYVTLSPILLNIDLTFKCNMTCKHCVARDMENFLGGREKADLKISRNLINSINQSPFMVTVITGGEPFTKECEESLTRLIEGFKNKGIIIDTNGTIVPSKRMLQLLKKKDVMVRVSWDSLHPEVENKLRTYPKGMYRNEDEYLLKKQEFLEKLVSNKIEVAIQSVIHAKNYSDNNFYEFPIILRSMKIDRWYLQRYIPTHFKEDDKYIINIKEYEESIRKIQKIAKQQGITCHTKKDRRHNSVFLLVKDGSIYTQSDDKPGEKVYLGELGKIINYFEFVSASEHTVRYAIKVE